MGSSVKTNCKIHAIAIGITLQVEAFNDLFVRSRFNQQQKMLMIFLPTMSFLKKNLIQIYIKIIYSCPKTCSVEVAFQHTRIIHSLSPTLLKRSQNSEYLSHYQQSPIKLKILKMVHVNFTHLTFHKRTLNSTSNWLIACDKKALIMQIIF